MSGKNVLWSGWVVLDGWQCQFNRRKDAIAHVNEYQWAERPKVVQAKLIIVSPKRRAKR